MPTKVVVVTINKGGVGKTMLCRSLGVAAAQAGQAVLMLDVDTHQNSTSLRKRRPEDDKPPLVQFTTESDLEETLSRARAAGSDLVVIDTPPSRNTEAPADVEVADLVLIHCEANVETFEGLPRTTRLARNAEKPAAVVPVVLHRFNVNRDSSLRGKTAQELQPDSKVVARKRSLDRSFVQNCKRQILQLCTR